MGLGAGINLAGLSFMLGGDRAAKIFLNSKESVNRFLPGDDEALLLVRPRACRALIGVERP